MNWMIVSCTYHGSRGSNSAEERTKISESKLADLTLSDEMCNNSWETMKVWYLVH